GGAAHAGVADGDELPSAGRPRDVLQAQDADAVGALGVDVVQHARYVARAGLGAYRLLGVVHRIAEVPVQVGGFGHSSIPRAARVVLEVLVGGGLGARAEVAVDQD